MGNVQVAEPRGEWLCPHCKKLVPVNYTGSCIYCYQQTTKKRAPGDVVCPTCRSDWTSPNNQSCTICRRSGGPSGRGKVIPVENKRYFGTFVCHNCSRTWSSANSWSDAHQNCLGCGLPVRPTSLSLTKKGPVKDPDNKKRHLKELCQKCQQLGYHCQNLDPSPLCTSTKVTNKPLEKRPEESPCSIS